MTSLHEYQNFACNFALERFAANMKGTAWFLEPGMGKTLATLELIRRLRIYDSVESVLIVAPLRVMKTVWPKEIDKWGYDFQCSIIHGTPEKRSKALRSVADIYLINPENIPWLEEQGFGFDMLVVDESTKFKTWSAKRSKALRKMLPPKRLILTGTPASEGYQDLYAQMFLLDEGNALGRNITAFRKAYMYRGGYENRQWFLQTGAEEAIRKQIKSMCLYQSAVEHLDMPDLIHNVIDVELPPRARKIYEEAEAGLLVDLDRKTLGVLERGGAYVKCKQMAAGRYYADDDVIELHYDKLDALEDLVEELQGKPLIIGYQYAHDWEAISERFPQAKNVDGKTKDIPAEFSILACQTRALSHGIDGLQSKCADIAWYTLTDSREVFDQFIARVYRQGQAEKQVRVHYLISKNTVDVALMRSLRGKGKLQEELLAHLKR